MITETERPRGVFRALADRPAALAGSYLLLAIVLAALGWSGLWSMFSLLPDRVSPWWGLATAAPACALVLLRRRAPLAGLVAAAIVFVADLLTVGGLVPLLVLLELFHARTVRLAPARRRRMLWVMIVSTLALVVSALALADDPREAVMVGIQFVGLAGLTYWYANSVAQSRELVALYRQRADDTARLAALDRTAAVQGERDRMARELHDVVAGHISAIAIRSEAALGLQTGDAEETQERRALRAMRDASLEAHGALRTMIQVLRSGESDFQLPPGRAGLPGLVEAANGSGVAATLNDEGGGGLPAQLDQAVGSVVREALANSVRHSSGADVDVRLSRGEGEVRVNVVSRGGSALASPALAGSGMGLELLRERVRALGGELFAGPEGAGVWAVRARLPEQEGACARLPEEGAA